MPLRIPPAQDMAEVQQTKMPKVVPYTILYVRDIDEENIMRFKVGTVSFQALTAGKLARGSSCSGVCFLGLCRSSQTPR